jgi:hypothetical protein
MIDGASEENAITIAATIRVALKPGDGASEELRM